MITNQALQKGWGCAFAYISTIRTNPGSQIALTRWVGRILSQPCTRKTHVPLFWTRASSSVSSTAAVGCCNYGLACGTAARNSVGCGGHAEFLVALHLGVQSAPVLRLLRFRPELRETMRQSTSEAQRQTDEKGSRSQREPDSIVSVCERQGAQPVKQFPLTSMVLPVCKNFWVQLSMARLRHGRETQ